MKAITGFLQAVARRQDLLLVGILVMTIVLMILPMPTILIDALIALNISLTVLILIVAIYLDKPVSFSTFPGIILIATAFRLAISISTTRLILSEADAGAIIETFGTFVTAGNVIVGLVIFLIITTVQFVVITKGSERVAEVAARFILDALPGRQMSIDAELRAGDIDQAEARRRRRQLDTENQFFGAMDGAMKFVKGDAIAGLIIIAVNLIGGIAIGTAQMGMSIGEAAQVYSRLTVGDGLVAQIPALFMALCAGAVITRVTAEGSSDLGTDIARQLAGSARTLGVAAFIVAAIGFVPGFPTLIFLLIGAGLGALAWTMLKTRDAKTKKKQTGAQTLPASTETGQAALTADEEIDPQDAYADGNALVVVRVGKTIGAAIDPVAFVRARRDYEERVRTERGIDLPTIGLLVDHGIGADQVDIILDQVALFSASVPAQTIVARTHVDILDLADAPRARLGQPWPVVSGFFVPENSADALTEAGAELWSIPRLFVEVAGYFVGKNASGLVGFDEVQRMVQEVQADSPHLAEQIASTLPVTKMLEVLRRLVAEDVPLRPRRILFEALAEWSAKESNVQILTEYVRKALRRQICQSFADHNRVIAGYILEPELEQELREALRETEAGTILSLPARTSSVLLEELENVVPPADIFAKPPVIVTSVDLRRHVHAYLETHGLELHVVSFQEIAAEFHLQPIGTLSGRKQEAYPDDEYETEAA